MSKIDRLVAERVMNWRTHARNTAWWVDADVETGLVPSGGVRGLTSGMDRWSPSTSIKTAWEVVEHLRKQTKDDGTRKYLVSIIDDVGSVEVQIEEVCREEFHSWEVWHGQEPMGICAAALLAFGVTESEIQEAMR